MAPISAKPESAWSGDSVLAGGRWPWLIEALEDHQGGPAARRAYSPHIRKVSPDTATTPAKNKRSCIGCNTSAGPLAGVRIVATGKDAWCE
jgi:hypothetical protein